MTTKIDKMKREVSSLLSRSLVKRILSHLSEQEMPLNLYNQR